MDKKEKYKNYVIDDLVSKTKWDVSQNNFGETTWTKFQFPFSNNEYTLNWNNGGILRFTMVMSAHNSLPTEMINELTQTYGVSKDMVSEVVLTYWDKLMMNVFGKMDSRRLVKKPRISESVNMTDKFIEKIEAILNIKLEGNFDWLNSVRIRIVPEGSKYGRGYLIYTVVFNDVVEDFDFTWKRKDGRSQQDVMEIISNFHSKIFSGQKIMFSTDSDLPNNIITKYKSFPYIPLNPLDESLDRREKYFNYVTNDLVKKTTIDFDREVIIFPFMSEYDPYSFHDIAPHKYISFTTSYIGGAVAPFVRYCIANYGTKQEEVKYIWGNYIVILKSLLDNG